LQVLIVQQHKWVPAHKHEHEEVYKSVHQNLQYLTNKYVHFHMHTEVSPHAQWDLQHLAAHSLATV
jgi:hypothetical protein